MEPERDSLTLKDADFSKVERQFLRIKDAAPRSALTASALSSAFEKARIWESDPAKEFAAQMLNKPYDQVTREERKEAKNHPLFFLMMYGSRPPKP